MSNNYEVGRKVIYNKAKKSVHHIGTIVKIDKFIHVKFMFSEIQFPLDGFDKTFNRKLILVDDDYEV